MFYTIYKTTNTINNKIYIGMHKTKNLNDGYLGSGDILKLAIKKYGKDSFIKEILFIFDNEEEMVAKEMEIVTLDFIAENNTYNIRIGGSGNGRIAPSYEQRQMAWQTHIKLYGTKHFVDARARNWKLGLQKAKELYPEGTWKDRKHSEETKQKMRDSAVGKHDGQKNSQFGTMWITDGITNKKVRTDHIIQDGWRKGRV